MSLTLSGIVIESRASDKFINATQLCHAGGKVFKDWSRLESTKKLIKELEVDLNANGQICPLKLIDKKVGGNHSGSWIHPDLAVQLAQWISPSFAIQVSRWIRELFITGTVSVNSIRSDEEVKRLEDDIKEKQLLIEAQANLLEEEKAINKKLKRRELALTSIVKNLEKLEKNQIFYLATTQVYAANNKFEYGGCVSKDGLRQRICSYNTGRAEQDLLYYTKIICCNDYKTVENRVGNILARFKDKPNAKKEMVHMRYDSLVTVIEFICENYDREIDFLNQWCEDFFNKALDEEPIIPEPLDIQALFVPQIEQAESADHIEVVVQRAGTRQSQKIDISDWTDEQIHQIIIEIVERCAREQKPDYDFAAQKDTVAVSLVWKVIAEFMLAYKGYSKTEWRVVFKNWYATQDPKKLHIKYRVK